MLLCQTRANSTLLFKHLLVADSSLQLLTQKSYLDLAQGLNEILSTYHYFINTMMQNNTLSHAESVAMAMYLKQFTDAIRQQRIFDGNISDTHSAALIPHNHLCLKLNQNWNQVCELVNN